ncbi:MULTISPECIES: transcriptional regulator [Oligella]|uniref:transcriptional regulator n=1 Tax=Oligella TaxID=90243 RepID=UPI00068CB55F|nr:MULTISPECIES: hypothetical protein [Oligella]OFS84501.1 hypothetical protein HMPREF3144_06555 [Oligella sp. HMSC05A10]SUA58257.1 Uncharacterized protein conserved in bacteria, prophage-related [Oligella urethralis]
MRNTELTKLKQYASERPGFMTQLSEHLSISPSYLSQMVSGLRAMRPAYATAVEEFTGGAVSRIDCRPKDGFDIWPELKKDSSNQESKETV